MKGRTSKADYLRWRIVTLKIFFFLIGAAIVSRLFSLQIVHHENYSALAERQQGTTLTLSSKRGTIYFQDKDGNLQIAALNKEWPAVALTPNIVTEPAVVESVISETLGIASSTISAILEKKNDPFEMLARKVDGARIDALQTAIQSTGVTGIAVFPEFRRFYPNGDLAARVLGFVNFDHDTEHGQYGIERYYDDELSGTSGIFSAIQDGSGNLLSFGREVVTPHENGDSVVLTIDPNVQRIAEDEIRKVVKKWNAASGSFLIMDPMTGEIIAMGAVPSFDPNIYSAVSDISVFRNPLIDSQFELGSIFKPITMSAGIEERVVTPETTYTDTGDVAVDGYHIKNYDLRAHGVQTMTQVLEKSLNTGVMFVESRLGKDRFLSYVQKFGFGETTGIAFPNEIAGDISNLFQKRDVDYATASFGQGIAITPIQIATAVSAIANGGNLMEPMIVSTITDDSGNTKTFQPHIRRRVISSETSETLTRMLISAVQNGFENHAAVEGYFIAGKTGTAQVPKKNGRGYEPNTYTHSFVGYAPAFHPKFLIFLQLNEPKGITFASSSLTPTFHTIAQYMLNYYQIPFDYDPTTKLPVKK